MSENDEPSDLRDVEPTSFRHIIGQRHVREALQIAVEASFAEGKRLDDLLLCGPPGLGKSGLAAVLANELSVSMTEVLAQSITNTAELNSVLLSATEGILFLDEIHLLHPVQQHALLQVLDKRRIFYPRRVQQVVKMYAERAGVRATPHTFRHQAITWLTRHSGLADAELQLITGHSRRESLALYQHVALDGDLAAKYQATVKDVEI